MFEIHSPSPFSRRDDRMPPILGEAMYLDRRRLIRALGFTGALAAMNSGFAQVNDGVKKSPLHKIGDELSYPKSTKWVPKWNPPGGSELYPAKRNGDYGSERPLTPEDNAATKNNYYEFLPDHAGPVYEFADKFKARPWTIEIAGLVESAKHVELDDFAKIAPLEERIYRHRCVEAWSMVVPWTGFPLAKLIAWCKPKAQAKYVRFVSFQKPDEAPGQKEATYYKWPYYEALRLDEATNPLAFVVTGIYGHGLPTQHGAPVRVHVPWKYGYKSPKGIVKLEFVADEPKTFWNDVAPKEYSFLSNVDPNVPHPRWSQATERDIATGDRIPTLAFNGYEELVGELYKKS